MSILTYQNDSRTESGNFVLNIVPTGLSPIGGPPIPVTFDYTIITNNDGTKTVRLMMKPFPLTVGPAPLPRILFTDRLPFNITPQTGNFPLMPIVLGDNITAVPINFSVAIFYIDPSSLSPNPNVSIIPNNSTAPFTANRILNSYGSTIEYRLI